MAVLLLFFPALPLFTDANGMLLNTGDFTFYNLKEKEIL